MTSVSGGLGSYTKWRASKPGSHTGIITRQQRAQGHGWPRASRRHWAAVLRRKGQYTGKVKQGGASRRCWHITRVRTRITGKRSRWREEKDGCEVLTLGRRCRRGRLGEDGWRGKVVHGGVVPALLLLLCVDVPEWLPRTAPRCARSSAAPVPACQW
jgi:hypothetical protein